MLRRKAWKPLPAVVVLAGNAPFFREQITARFSEELFGSEGVPRELRRFQGPASERELSELPLSQVLDDLRTPSFFSPYRLVVVDRADAFLAAHREALEPFVASGFAGGHLILSLEKKIDMRTRFSRAVAAHGWIVKCEQPYDRPPPWETRTPVWESDLSHWVQQHAREKGLVMDTRTAFALHDRVGTDLAALDEELEKIATYLAEKKTQTVTEEAIVAVTGDQRGDSIFSLVDLILERRRLEAIQTVARLFTHGSHSERGVAVLDPPAIVLPLISALVGRLRALRRAHAIASPDAWIREKLVQKPFLPRLQRQLRATPPGRIRDLLQRLYWIDRSIKRGGDPHRLLLLLVAE
ncbi:MAG: DNA polymerase III subunit delta [Planctomycetes bacterium]|nr:DNA polymerase III subunit delta [Planctomycetota bacterium]